MSDSPHQKGLQTQRGVQLLLIRGAQVVAVFLHFTTALRYAFSYLASKILTTRCVASKVLLGSLIMTLLFAIHALSFLALVESLVMSLIGKMISSMSICFVQKFRKIPNSFKVLVE